MARKKKPVEQPAPVATVEDPQLLAIMQTLGAGAHGLTPRCCERIREFVTTHFPASPHDKHLAIAGELGAIIRQESWGLLVALHEHLTGQTGGAAH